MCKRLTGLRSESDWLAEGSQTAQQQALKDLDQAFRNRFKNPGHFGLPTWRKHGINEGFRIVGPRAACWRRLNRHWGEVNIPKVGWVRFRWSRHPCDPKSYRVKKDRTGRWWICFATIPEPIKSPGNGKTVGIDRGIAHSFITSEGEFHDVPGLTPEEERRLLRLQRKLAKQELGSNRRQETKLATARLIAKKTNRKKDMVEKLTTQLAESYEWFHIENLNIGNMTRSAKGTLEKPGKNVAQKRGLNRGILNQGWGLFTQRMEDKAPGRVIRINPAYTSQCCSVCRHVAKENRKSQALFLCQACGYRDNADINSAKNLSRGPGWATSPDGVEVRKAAGHAVSARGESVVLGSMKREPQLTC